MCPHAVPYLISPDFAGNEKHKWFAVHVRSNFERIVSGVLQGKGLEQFLPTYRARRRWSDRIKEDDLPLFPGYVFCRLNQYDRFPVLSTAGVVGIVGIGKTPVPVTPEELQAIWRITHSDLVVNPWPHLEPGETVVIEEGPLTGVQGVLKECKNQRQLIVTVSLLQRSVAVEIDRAHVSPLNGLHALIGRSLSQETRRVPEPEVWQDLRIAG